MDSNTAVIFSAILGGLIGGPIGYFVERTFTRPRLKIEYGDTRYEDLVSLPIDLQQKLTRISGFVNFVESQIKWQFTQRLNGNLFTKQELSLVRELATHWSEMQNIKKQRIERDKNVLYNNSENDLEKILSDWLIDYRNSYDSRPLMDMKNNHEETLKRIATLMEKGCRKIDLCNENMKELVNFSDNSISQRKGKSDRIIIRIGLSNNGLQDGIIQSEAILHLKSKKFRLPILHASRPWEVLENKELSQYVLVSARSFQVIDFVLDERLNAPADIEELKSQLRVGCTLKFDAKGINGASIMNFKFLTQLIE